MTIPKFEPVAEVLWYDPALRHTPEPAGKIIDGSMSFIESADIGTQLYTADQLTEAYEAGKREASEDLEQAAFEKWLYDKCPSGDVESVQRQWLESYEYAELAGKRDATPEGYALVPKQPTLLMLRAMYPCESTTEAYKAMLAAAPERRRMMTLVELLQQAASESDTPNTSIEGKAANLIERQAAQIEGLNGRFAKDQERIACQSEYLAKQAAQIEQMRQQLSAALAACKQKDEALNRVWLKVIKGFSTTEWAFLAKAMAIRPDAAALEQFAAKVREQCAEVCEAEYVNVADGDDEVYNSAITHASRGIRAIKELP